MARPREFDEADALDKAMQVFWFKGYEGAGISDLLEAMQIARGSLYKAFGDKKGLFLAALKQYETSCIEPGLQLLNDKKIPDGAQRIQLLLETVVAVVENGNDRRGCFLCNTAVDQAPHDPEISKTCQDMMGKMVQGFFCALKDAAQHKDLDEEALQKKAMGLNIAYNGLRVIVKAGYTPEDVRKTINSILAEFDLLE
ncbi:TetR/AcrR family transcriptional regulator [Kiloniella sp. EL199]|uniref:TetR/AcrR family transcriptional regulator n=1 Tax=Kiloniella sp. EL199 TaxID=2107581 RepID=UPI000EA32C9A|nr:TetR/AcrR family transcriptional regulator [Kiloniella sp. EL199]